MCVGKRNRTDRSSIRMGWDNMVSGTSGERFVFRENHQTFQVLDSDNQINISRFICCATIP